MTHVGPARRRNRNALLPPLAIIVIVLLCVLGLVAAFRSDGVVTSPDARIYVPLDRPDRTPVPEPLPTPLPRPG